MGFSKDSVLRVLGWIMIIFVLPNLIIWSIFWYFQRPAKKCLADCTKPAVCAEPKPQKNPFQQPSMTWNLAHRRKGDANNNYDDHDDGADIKEQVPSFRTPREIFEGNICNYLGQIRFQANRDRLTDIAGLSPLDLQYRADQLGSMLHFLTRDGKQYFERAERRTLKDQLRNQSALITMWQEIKQKSQNAMALRFNARFNELMQQQQHQRRAVSVD